MGTTFFSEGQPTVDLPYLNDQNGASHVVLRYCDELARTVTDRPLLGAEFGVAFGGGVQRLGRLWKPFGGTVYGFDTFTGHPKHLAPNQGTMEAICMDCWYKTYGVDGITYDFQRRVLDDEGLTNVILRPGLIDEHSMDDVPYLHYALLDLDIVSAMNLAWRLVRTRMLPGGYLCLHDVLPAGHIAGLEILHQAIKDTGEYETVLESDKNMLAVLRRR